MIHWDRGTSPPLNSIDLPNALQTEEEPRNMNDWSSHAMQMGRLAAWKSIVHNLNRCEHGRHQGDACFDCPEGISHGNPILPVGTVIGYNHGGDEMVIPERDHWDDIDAWVRVRAQRMDPKLW